MTFEIIKQKARYSTNNSGLPNTPEDHPRLLFSITIKQSFLGLNFGHEFHIPKQEKISISTCVRKHLICELQLKEHCVDTTSGSALMYGQGLLGIVC
jgi:hypothetical protein